jgi:hypothetical protein
MSTVHLNDQAMLDAAEVNNVRPERMLATELHAELMASQTHPELAFGVGLPAAQPPRQVAWENWCAHC